MDGSPPDRSGGPPPPRPCPICRKPRETAHAPFCSKRCATIDLGRWLKGSYAVPTDETPDEDGEENRG